MKLYFFAKYIHNKPKEEGKIFRVVGRAITLIKKTPLYTRI